jgi:hypothetical protein
MSLFRSTRHDILLGTVSPHLLFNQLSLTPADQEYHATVWGRTGSGKSKLLQSIFIQHLNKGHGVGLVEPHHDLSFDTLTYLIIRGYFRRPDAYERLIYLDWGNGAFVPFNVLADARDPHSAALNALEAMLRVWPELREAPLFQTLFLSSLMVLIANELPITFLYQLLSDGDFRHRCLKRVTDPLIHQTFDSFDKLGRDQVQAAGSTLRRAFLLSFSPLARYTLGQPENWLNFRQLMDEGRSVIINLGNVNDHETRRLLGAMLLVQIEQAALSRTDQAPSQRTPFTLLVDEWPSFAAQDDTIGTILSQTRKFKLRLYLAAQSLAQISSSRLSGALENCRLTIAFGLGRDSAEAQSRHIGGADPFALKEERLTELQHSQYLTILEQFESWTQQLQNLPPRTAFLKRHDSPAVLFRTLTVADARVNTGELSEVLATYRRRYQRTADEADCAIATLGARLGGQDRETGAAAPAYTRLFQRPQTTDEA